MSFFKSLPFLLVLPVALHSQPAIAQCNEINVDKWFDEGTNAHRQLEYQKAETIWRKYLQCKPNTAEARYRLGRALRDQDRLDEAIVEFKKAIELDPNHSYAYNGLGMVYSEQNKLEKAINAYEKAVELNPKNIQASGNLGNVYAYLNQWDNAIRVYQKVIDISPPTRYDLIAWARNYKADVLIQMGREGEAIVEYERAIAEYQKATQNTPSDRKDLIASNHIRLGSLLSEMGRESEAIAEYEKAIKIGYKSSSLYYRLGKAYYLQSNFQQASYYYRKALEINPRNSFAYNGLGIIYLNQGNRRAAITNFEQATRINPNFASARNNLRRAENQRNIELQRQNSQTNIAFSGNNRSTLSEAAYKSTVRIKSRDNQTLGTGWIVKKEGRTAWIVTNRHVVANDNLKQLHQKISVEFYDPVPEQQDNGVPFTKTNNNQAQAKIEKYTSFDNSDLDLAVLKVNGVPSDIEAFSYLPGKILPLTPILIIGHPNNIEENWFPVAGKATQIKKNKNKIYINAPLALGNSGSPVLNEQGQVIGMVMRANGKRDSDPNPNEPSSEYDENDSSTSGHGVGYPIDEVIKQLRVWNIL